MIGISAIGVKQLNQYDFIIYLICQCPMGEVELFHCYSRGRTKLSQDLNFLDETFGYTIPTVYI